MSETNNEGDGRLSFKEAVAYVMQTKQAAFSAMPVFGDRTEDEEQTAEGARIFIVEPNPEEEDWQLRFIAGPFFSNAYAVNDIIPPEELPDSVRELRYMPARVDTAWYDEQIQVLIQKLVQAAGIAAEQMPDYASAPTPAAGPEAVFPISFIGRGEDKQH